MKTKTKKTWHMYDGNAEITGEFTSGEEAAQEFVDGGEWGDSQGPITIRCWQEDEDGERYNEEEHEMSLPEPDEPPCTGSDHDWQSPWEIVGGIEENPGVWGEGGGVTIVSCCMRCGCRKTIDTSATCNNGDHYTHVDYEEGYYSEEIGDCN